MHNQHNAVTGEGNALPITPERAKQILLAAKYEECDDLDTYINGADSPNEYFATFESEAELVADYEMFLWHGGAK